MQHQDKELQGEIDRVSILAEPLRRQLYLYVAGQTDRVGRDQAANAAGISRRLAAFHLDRLVESGLLEVSYRRLTGKTGPGAGRPSKLYRRSPHRIPLALSAREEPVAARILARAMESGESVESLKRAALSWGREMGREARERAGRNATPAEVLRQALDALTQAGFDPRPEADGKILLGRCPFEASKSDATVRICHMNLALCRGLVEGLASPQWSVRLDPKPGRCCTVFESTAA
jgi:predicted ArsR family transcriptional regulator